MKVLHKIIYHTLWALWWLISAMPMAFHYLIANILYFIVRYVIRYRRSVVHRNIKTCFPEMSHKKRLAIECRFYLFFCDYIVESIKFFSISKRELKYRMEFRGLERVEESLRQGHSVAGFLGHYGNWEWVSSLPLWIDPKLGKCLQLYHPLRNQSMDKLMGYIRERMGSTNIPMKESLRHIMRYQKEGTPVIVGFIADQAPKWSSVSYWMPFFGQDTPVLTGADRIAKKMGMDCYFIHISRKRRGRYVAEFQLMTDDSKNVPEYWITEEYNRRMEQNIREHPSYWLWTHDRFKRTRQEFIERIRRNDRPQDLETARFYDHEHPEGLPVLEWEQQNKK